jgi:RecB family endonuclease NucS
VKVIPTLYETEELISKSVSKHLFVLIVSNCRVDYRGRSTSTLGWGDRLVMLKPDGSVLVHRKTGYDAVNWQPPGALISVSIQDDELIIRADRRKPRESLTVFSKDICFVSAFSLDDEASLDMLLTEKDVYKVLLENPDLIDRGFRISSEQKNLGGGRADLSGHDISGKYTVVEIKKVSANDAAVKQLYKYVADMRKTSKNIRAILIAPSIQPTAQKLLRNLKMEFKRIDLKKCAEILSKKKHIFNENLDRHLKE